MLAKVIKCALIVSTLSGSAAYAFDFSNADELFRQRGAGISAITAARDAYRAATPSVTDAEKVYAYVQLARLDYYQGFLDTSNEGRKVIFQRCLNDIENIKSETSPEYVYWKATCLASWAQANGVLASLSRSAELAALLEKGNAIDARYEGGGFNRILGSMFIKLPAMNPFGPAGSIDKAIAYTDAAIASPAYPGALEPETATGDYYFNVYVTKAETLDAKGQRAEAVQVLQDAIDRIEGGDVPQSRIPETNVFLQDLKAALARMQ